MENGGDDLVVVRVEGEVGKARDPQRAESPPPRGRRKMNGLEEEDDAEEGGDDRVG